MSKGIWVNKNTFMKFSEKPKNWKLTDEIASRKRSMDFSTIGTMLPNPDSVLRKLGKNIEVYEEISKESHVSTCITNRKAGVTSLSWELGEGQKKTKEVQMIEERYKEIQIYEVMDEILEATMYGYKPIEVMWEKSTGYWLPEKLTGKPPEWFCFDTENNLRFKSRDSSWEGEILPERKFLCPTHGATYKNPYGVPELSKVFWPVTFKKGSLQFWIVFIEKYGMPLFLGKHPPGATEKEKTELAQALENAVQDAIIIISQNSNCEIVESPYKANSTGTYKTFYDTCNSEISKSLLGQTLTTEMGEVGARAASETHYKILDAIKKSDRNLTTGTIDTLSRWIRDLNFPDKEVPQFKLREPEGVKLELAQRDETLSRTGVKFNKIYFQNNYNFKEEDFDIAEPQQQNTFPPAQFAEPAAGVSPLSELENAVSDKELQQIAEELLKPVIDLVKNGNSYEDVLESLSEQYPLMNTKAMEDLFTKAMFASETTGKLSNITK